MPLYNLHKHGHGRTVSELSVRKFMREKDQINKACQARHELEEQTRARKLEAAMRHEQEEEAKLKRIEEIKRKRQELLAKNKQKQYDIEFTRERTALRNRKLTDSKLSLPSKTPKETEDDKQKMIELKQEQERLEKRRFSAELADRAVLISYQRLPTVLNLIRSYSRNDFNFKNVKN